jgi:fibronectin type 3 domain-containing protein
MKLLLNSLLIFLTISLFNSPAIAYDTTLAWDPSPELNIVGYNLYVRDNTSESFSLLDDLTINEINQGSPQFMVKDMENDVAYDFVVTAVNGDGLESAFSNVVSVLNGSQTSVPFSNTTTSAGGGGGSGCFITVTGVNLPSD